MVCDQILRIREVGTIDDSITNVQYHVYNPYTTTYNNNDEIRISIQQQDLYLWPHDSYIYIEGEAKLVQIADQAARPAPYLINNAIAFLFDEIRYEINGVPIDTCKNVGITSTMKGLVSFRPDDLTKLELSGWNLESNTDAMASAGHLTFHIPLKYILGFAEDYQNVVINAKHELILIRSRNNINAFVGGNDNISLKLNKIQWRMPHVNVSDTERLKLLRIIERKQSIPIHFRSWELYEYPVLPLTDRHIWSVKTSTQLNTPRYILIGLQTDRNNKINKDKSRFDHCGITDVKLYLNSECYPYENMDLKFDKNQYKLLYDMFSRFQETYFHDRQRFNSVPLVNLTEFKSISPLIVFDCSHQNEVLKKSVIDIRIVIQTKDNIPENTSAYCLILHDSLVTYNPYTNIVNRAL